MTPSDMGIWILKSTCARVMPMPSPASMIAGIHAADGGVGGAQDGQLGIEHQGDDGRHGADAVAEDRQKGDHQAEEGDGGHGHHDPGQVEHGVRQPPVEGEIDPQRHARDNRDGKRNADEDRVLPGQVHQLGPVAHDEIVSGHGRFSGCRWRE